MTYFRNRSFPGFRDRRFVGTWATLNILSIIPSTVVKCKVQRHKTRIFLTGYSLRKKETRLGRMDVRPPFTVRSDSPVTQLNQR
ncbi:hypothetical protein K443DRAFT_281258 [Laccaria amethystina LaAM-08-1]|uniref:Uncharacterized protein n=1 Tax=Laccaria amethystina LaAM-08-1 TaxID=1095629 RepID=A0A0C9WKS4_9AGAR|nr:hypothetical protein K443DRAFT_281258 [Laccaria amethystina LaAM-08-1]